MANSNSSRKGSNTVRIELDERTETMTQEALYCRTYGHPWVPVPVSRSRQNELRKAGQFEDPVECGRCETRRITVYDLHTFEAVLVRTEYPKDGYLSTSRGSGRIPRAAARKAMLVRTKRL